MSSDVQPKCTSSSTAGVAPLGGELLAHEIFHGLHVVVDAALDGLDGGRRIVARLEREARGELLHGVGQRLRQDLRHGFGQRQQPGGFDAHALADQAAFRQHRAQRVGALAVSAIDGRERQECCGIHERHASKRAIDWPRMISQGDNVPGRKEHDSFGDIEVPAGALWGAQTERARRNFQLRAARGCRADFIAAVALIKAAAARANARLGLLPADIARAHRRGGAGHRARRARRTSFRSMCSRPAAAPAPT